MTQTTVPSSGAATFTAAATLTGPIVVAVGGVDPDSVLRAARNLAPASAAGVVAVAVLPPISVTITGESAWMVPAEYETERFSSCSATLAHRLAAFGGAAPTWKKQVIRGVPALALADFAREEHAAMLIVGIGRHRPLDRIVGAETALRTIRRAPCPVLVVHPDFDGPFHDVVVATDFSPASVAAAQAVVPLLSPVATLHIVHVWQPSDEIDPRKATADEAYVNALPEHFQRFRDLLPLPSGVTVKTEVREGRAAERVMDYAKAHHADLVTAGRHGRSLLQRLLVGSQTTALVRGAERSLLIAPEPPFAERDRMRLLLTGTSESRDPAEWEAQLRGVTERNHGRVTVVEIDDLLFRAQVIESGYELLSTAYDAKMKRVEVTLGDVAHGARRVTRTFGDVDSIAIAADSTGRDVGMRITHGAGQTLLTFLGE